MRRSPQTSGGVSSPLAAGVVPPAQTLQKRSWKKGVCMARFSSAKKKVSKIIA
jgi:hypothetical protein